MRDDDTIELFMNRVQYVVNALHSYGEQLDDTWIIEKVLRILPRKFDPLTITIEDYKKFLQLTLP